jgi:hypothetical protein
MSDDTPNFLSPAADCCSADSYLSLVRQLLLARLTDKLSAVYVTARTPSGKRFPLDVHEVECQAAYTEYTWAWNQAKKVASLCFPTPGT